MDLTATRQNVIDSRPHDCSRQFFLLLPFISVLPTGLPSHGAEHFADPVLSHHQQELPPIVIAETETKTIIQYETLPPLTVTVPPPANTRRAAFPIPEGVSSSFSTAIPRTTAITYEEELVKEPLRMEEVEEYEIEEYEEEEEAPVAVRRNVKPARRPPPSRSGWLW
ncbi:hypothetical protein JVU11DRAFT_582 [Chiua virens]|nr:hypothetical protein JVU11DRAFT_582 [Chiua virens]